MNWSGKGRRRSIETYAPSAEEELTGRIIAAARSIRDSKDPKDDLETDAARKQKALAEKAQAESYKKRRNKEQLRKQKNKKNQYGYGLVLELG